MLKTLDYNILKTGPGDLPPDPPPACPPVPVPAPTLSGFGRTVMTEIYALFNAHPKLAARLPRLSLGDWPTPLAPLPSLAAAHPIGSALLHPRQAVGGP